MHRAVPEEQRERGDMRLIGEINGRNLARFAALAATCTLTVMMFAPHAGAQTNPAGSQPSEARPAPPSETVQTIFLKNATGQNDLNDIASDLRNVLPRARFFRVQSQNAITLHATKRTLRLRRNSSPSLTGRTKSIDSPTPSPTLRTASAQDRSILFFLRSRESGRSSNREAKCPS